MNKEIKWSEKYKLSLKETLSIREIMKLRGCGQPRAKTIRYKAINYCKENNIDYCQRAVPTEAILAVTKLDENYYYNKMIQESKCI